MDIALWTVYGVFGLTVHIREVVGSSPFAPTITRPLSHKQDNTRKYKLFFASITTYGGDSGKKINLVSYKSSISDNRFMDNGE